MLSSIEEFIKYMHGQRRRTQWLVDVMPADKAQWSPWPGEYSPSEILCRVAAGHLMYATVVAHNRWHVADYSQALPSWDSALTFFRDKTEEALDLLRPLPDAVLNQKRRRPGNNPPTFAWRYLMAMVEHEIAHRAMLSSYLMLLNIRRPQMGGVTLDNVRALLNGQSTLEDEL